MAGLHSLWVTSAKLVTDEGLAHLRSLSLKHLDLSHARHATDAGMAHVASIGTLETLNLWYCRKLTSTSIADLKRLRNLKKITLVGSQIDRQAFQSAFPNCEIAQ